MLVAIEDFCHRQSAHGALDKVLGDSNTDLAHRSDALRSGDDAMANFLHHLLEPQLRILSTLCCTRAYNFVFIVAVS